MNNVSKVKIFEVNLFFQICNMLTFVNTPKKNVKLRSDYGISLKGENKKIVSLKVNNNSHQPCKLVVKLLLKDFENENHFHKLCTSDGQSNVHVIEYKLNTSQSIVKLDFFRIKSTIKKESLKELKERFQENAKNIYQNNYSTLILQIALVDVYSSFQYSILKCNLNNKNYNIVIIDYSPKFILKNSDDQEITFVLEKSEKDIESICLELNNETKVRPKILQASLKNVFIYPLNRSHIGENFKARLYRKGSNEQFSDWKQFIVKETNMENAKRKANIDYDFLPQNKISRTISCVSSEDTLSQISLQGCLRELIVQSTSGQVKHILENNILAKIARVGHDYAFGLDVTEFMENVTSKLPIVYILQDDVGDTPLHNAILKNQEGRAIEILKTVSKHFPADMFTKNTSNHTALILAPACGVSAQFVQRLLFYGFNMKDKDIDGNSALSIAIEYQNTEVLETLVSNAFAYNTFEDNYNEIITLVRRTIIERYFHGYRIFMESHISWLHESDLNLDKESQEVVNQWIKNINYYITPLPELTDDDVKNILSEMEEGKQICDE